MSKTQFKIKVNTDGTIDATLLGSLPVLTSALVDVMEQNETIRTLILASSDCYNTENA